MKWLKRSPNDNHLPYSSSEGNTVRGAYGRKVYKCTSRIHGANYCWRSRLISSSRSKLPSNRDFGSSRQFIVGIRILLKQAMGDYVMSRRRNGRHSKFCSLVSRLDDRESGTKKLNAYAMTWDVLSNIEHNVVNILKFQFESISSGPGSPYSLSSVASIEHLTAGHNHWIMKRNIESSILFPPFADD